MKPNLVVFQAYHANLDPVIEQYCESFCETHYVYLIRPYSKLRDDSGAGVRFLNHPLESLPGFGSVDAAIAVGDPEVVARLRESYPDSEVAIWHPAETGELPELMLSLLRPTVVRGNFDKLKRRNLTRAM